MSDQPLFLRLKTAAYYFSVFFGGKQQDLNLSKSITKRYYCKTIHYSFDRSHKFVLDTDCLKKFIKIQVSLEKMSKLETKYVE